MLFKQVDGTIFDYNFTFLELLLRSFDRQLRFVRKAIDEQYGPDSTEYLNQLDYLAGVGFISCQQYITTINRATNLDVEQASKFPPLHVPGISVVTVIQAGANYWKHHEEWSDNNIMKRRYTIDVLQRAGIDIEGAYVCSDLMDKLCGIEPNPFARLKNLLVEWRNNVILYNDRRST